MQGELRQRAVFDSSAEPDPVLDKPLKWADKKDRAYKERCLRRWNIAAGSVHAASFIAVIVMTVIYFSVSVRVELTTDFRVYDELSVAPETAGNFTTVLESRWFYPVILVDLPFPLITSLFHLVLALSPYFSRRYNQLVFEEGRNPYRWLEYGITASLMTIVILQLSGATNVFLILMVGVVMNVALQFTGYAAENENVATLKGAKVKWDSIIAGFVIFAAQWAVIMSYFFTAVVSPRPPDADGVPWFVYTIIIGLFFQFAIFGFLLVLRYWGKFKFFASAYGTEIGFIILSLTSKLFLTWNLLIGIALGQTTS